MTNPLNEKIFEEHIASMLSNSVLYNERTSDNFDIEKLCDKEMLERFLRAQTVTWQRLSGLFPGKETETVIKEYNNFINRGDSILRLLQKGLTIKGVKVKFAQFKPVLDGPDSPSGMLYNENRFSVVRQMRYSSSETPYGSSSNESRNRLDLCILINGLPIITCELKNEGTGQNYGNGIYQYRYERNPENRLLRNCLVHFVMDNNYVFMTTKLNGEQTNFLPFNRNTVNPPVDGDYPTSYMWRSIEGEESNILGAESLLDIIENFIKRYNDENNKPVIIFPRFHQLRVVRKLRQKVREDGPGHNYLIEHSAGSGKTKSMSWLAHQLANMANPDRTPVFDSIIMVTDRIVLNRNMAEDVINFETTAGTVQDIRKGAKNLARALNEGHRIIISTVQKFAYALSDIKREKQRKYAIIIDEAHTAVGNESAKDLMNALSTDADLQSINGFDPADFEDEMDALMAYMQAMRHQMSHISNFAFTATPKDKTYVLYGENGKTAHDLYSMKQAIDEKFILDVVQNVKSYSTMFELIEKNPEEDQDKLFGEKKALRVIYDELNRNGYIKLRKANMMLDHFMHHTINKIGRKAKAMVVCDSRQAAADYKQLLDRLIHDQYDDKIKTLVAFSGEVEDSHGRKCSEASMNDDGVTDNDIAEKFKGDDYKILVVAEKFQTGFDQPLLHTMFVDRSLGGIQCIQTLSRLNRCCPGKEDTMVIDFRNKADDIRKSFQKYYTVTTLDGDVDTQRLYTMKSDIENYKVFNEDEMNEVVSALMDKDKAAGVPSKLKQIVNERIVDRMSEDDKDLYRKYVNRYVRQYGFLAQVMDFSDPSLEKFYVFCKIFYRYLPYSKEVLPMELLDLIDLDKLRIQMNFEGQLKLEDEEQKLISSRIGQPSPKEEDEQKSIKEILHLANSPYEQFLNENDKILKTIWDEVLVDPDVVNAFNANNSFDTLMNIVRDKFDDKIASQIERYYNFAEVLEKEKALSITLMKRFVEALAERAAKNKELVYDEEVLKDKIYAAMEFVMDDVCSHLYSLDKIIDTFFFVLKQLSIPSLDGLDAIIKNNLNNIYTNDQLSSIDKVLHFNSLAERYEAYLKKLYYLIYDKEVPSGPEGRLPTFQDAQDQFECLTRLYRWRTRSAEEDKYFNYLRDLRKWRNEVHMAPDTPESEVNTAIVEVVAMYLYVTGHSIDNLGMGD